MNDPTPCKNCGQRYTECHVECKMYNGWKIRREEEKERIKRQKDRDSDIITIITNIKAKSEKRRKK